jgi:hypothetical protein
LEETGVSTDSRHQTWFLDQLTKSEFFHQKLHEWKMLSVAEAVEAFRGETLRWNLPDLGISEAAWNRVIHRGIKPVTVFAHPQVLMTIPAQPVTTGCSPWFHRNPWCGWD